MTDDRAFRDFGLTLDLEPPLLDARRPLAMALRSNDADAAAPWLALGALEIERFEIYRHDLAERVQHAADIRGSWARAADAIAHLAPELEIWHVVATRARTGSDGAALRAGWVIVGRGPTARHAATGVERGVDAVREIASASLDYLRVTAVHDAEALLDLVRPACAPFATAIRRRRWSPPVSLARTESELPRRGLLLPWTSQRDPLEALHPWAPICDVLAAQPAHASFLVRVRPCPIPPAEVRAEAEAELASLAAARDQAQRVRDQWPESTVVVLEGIGALLELASARVAASRRAMLVADAMLATWEPSGAGLGAIAMAALVPHAMSMPGGPLVPPPALETVALEPGALWRPLDAAATPDLCVMIDEAPALIRTSEPPHDERSPLPCGRGRFHALRIAATSGAVIGAAMHGDGWRPARLSEDDRLRHVYVVGQTGTGKSTLLLNMVLQDIAEDRGITLLDPHGSLIDDVLKRLPRDRTGDVVVVDPSQLGRAVPLNPLHIADGDPERYCAARDRIIDELLDVFDAQYDLQATGGPMFEHYFRTFFALLMGSARPTDYHPVLPMIDIIMSTPRLAAALARRLGAHDPITLASLESAFAAKGDGELKNMVPYIVSKLTRFVAPIPARRMLCQNDCIDFDQVIASRQLLMISLSAAHVGREAAALIARQVILRLWIAAMRRGTGADQPAHFIYADEFHNFASERFTRLLAEARKFRLGLVLAHQYTSQLVQDRDTSVLDAILGNVGTTIAFRVGTRDAELLAEAFAPRASPTDITGLPNHVAIARSSGSLGNVPFTLRTSGPPPIVEDRAAAIHQLAGLAHGRDASLVDAELSENLAGLRNLAPPLSGTRSKD